MRLQETFKALSDSTRRQILTLLKDGPMNAQQIGEHFPISKATLSHHLSILKQAGLLLDEKKGTFIYYELNTSVIDELIGWISSWRGES